MEFVTLNNGVKMPMEGLESIMYRKPMYARRQSVTLWRRAIA